MWREQFKLWLTCCLLLLPLLLLLLLLRLLWLRCDSTHQVCPTCCSGAAQHSTHRQFRFLHLT